jgi:hypothetical protein
MKKKENWHDSKTQKTYLYSIAIFFDVLKPSLIN